MKTEFIFLIFLLACFSCGNKSNIQISNNTNDTIPDSLEWKCNGQQILNNGVNIKCKQLSTGESFFYCDCNLHFKETGKIYSEGEYYVDTLNKSVFRSGWHKYFDNKGRLQERVHYSIVVLDKGGLEEAVDQNIYFNEKNDTVYDQSSYFDFVRTDTIKLGEKYLANLNFKSKEKWRTIHYEMKLLEVDESMDSAVTKKTSFTYQFTPNKIGKYIFQGYFFFIKPAEDTAHSLVTSRYIKDEFYVVE